MKLTYILIPFILLVSAWAVIPKEVSVEIPKFNQVMTLNKDQIGSLQVSGADLLAIKEANKSVDKDAFAGLKGSGNERAISSIDQIRQMTEKTELHLALLDDYDSYKRYPSENRRFETSAQDPITQRYAVDERTTVNEDQVGMTIWSDKKFYLRDQTVNLFGFVVDETGQKQSTDFQAEVLFNNRSLGKVALEDQDRDQLFTYSLPLMDGEINMVEAGIYKVIIRNKEFDLVDAVTFTLSQPDIALTGEFRDSVTSTGDLLIEAEVVVAEKNKFYVQASLYSLTQVSIGVTQSSLSLSQGKHWIPLSFSGVMIQDVQESGPYLLKQVSLAKVTMPMQRAPLEQPGYQTDAYSLNEFSGDTLEDQSLLQ